MKHKILFAVTLVFICSQICCGQSSNLTDADSNSDGKVTTSEFKTYAAGKLQGFDKLEQFVKAVDADSNGEISQTEFEGRMEILQSIAAAADPKTEKKSDSKTAKKDLPAIKSFEKLKSMLKKNKLAEAAKLMTKRGADEFAVSQVVSAIGMTKMELPVPMPQIEEAIDEIESVVIEHKLEKLELDTSKMFRMETSIDGLAEDDDEEQGDEKQAKKEGQRDKREAARKEMDEHRKKIVGALDKDGKRWKIVGDLMKAKASSPFSMNHLVGKVKSSEEQKKTVYLTITPEMVNEGNEDGMMFQMIAPPTIIRMTGSGKDWKFDGTDQERTSKAVKEFMKNQRFGGSPETNDF